MGWKNSPTTVVNFDDLRIPEENLISKEGEGFKIAMKALDGGRINIGITIFVLINKGYWKKNSKC